VLAGVNGSGAAAVPFVSFVANKDPNGDPANYSFVLRGYVRHWLGKVWNEYERIKLKDILASGPVVKGKSSSRSSCQLVAGI
jgi:hypothetical protein